LAGHLPVKAVRAFDPPDVGGCLGTAEATARRPSRDRKFPGEAISCPAPDHPGFTGTYQDHVRHEAIYTRMAYLSGNSRPMRIANRICYFRRSWVSASPDFSFLAADFSAFTWSRSAFFVALDFSRWDRSNL
jgi:hypothetical protein